MDERWAAVAARAMDSLGVGPGEVVQVRDRSGRWDVLTEMLLAVEQRGATPLVQPLAPGYLRRLLESTDPAYLAGWDRHRLIWTESTDRVLVLSGDDLDMASTRAASRAWGEAVTRLTLAEERRLLPYLQVAVPTDARARAAGTSLASLEADVLPALDVSSDELCAEADRVLALVRGAHTIAIRGGGDCELSLALGGRRWLSDVGTAPSPESWPPAVQVVQNLPAGAVYTTVLEGATSGALRLPVAGPARDVVLRFDRGRIVSIDAAVGADGLVATFDAHSGEARRVSHIGVGLNRHLPRPLGWPIVDEHRRGCVLIAFGENRYLGGENASSLNVDFVIPDATLLADGVLVVDRGTMMTTA